MTIVFEGSPKFGGIGGDCALVTGFHDCVLIIAIDRVVKDVTTISMTPEQARALAQGIIEAANVSEAEASE